MTAGRLVGMAAVLMAIAVVSGCGRKAGLDTPYQAAVEARREAEKAGQKPLPPAPPPPVEDKPFILDPLL